MFWACISMVTEFVPPLILHFNSKYPLHLRCPGICFLSHVCFRGCLWYLLNFLTNSCFFYVFGVFSDVYQCFGHVYQCISMFTDVFQCFGHVYQWWQNLFHHSFCTLTQNTLTSPMSGNMFFESCLLSGLFLWYLLNFLTNSWFFYVFGVFSDVYQCFGHVYQCISMFNDVFQCFGHVYQWWQNLFHHSFCTLTLNTLTSPMSGNMFFESCLLSGLFLWYLLNFLTNSCFFYVFGVFSDVYQCFGHVYQCISMFNDVFQIFGACISMVTEFVPPLILHFNSKYPYISDVREYVFWVMFAFGVVSLISSQFLDQFLVFLSFWGVFWCISMFWTCISMYIDVQWCVSMFWACISMVTEFVPPLILHFNSKYPPP